MKKIILSILIILLSNQPKIAQDRVGDFLTYLSNLNSSLEKEAAIDSFINAIYPEGIPFRESGKATFIYHGNANSVNLAGDMNGWNGMTELSNFPGTTLFYLQQEYENDARLDYKFIINSGNWILDPLNPKTCSGGFGPNSELAMPDYEQPWEINYNTSIQHGTIQAKVFHSNTLNRNYQVFIYLPPGYSEFIEYPVVYYQDGSDYMNLAYARNIADNLLDIGRIKPVISVFVIPTNRNNEYAYGERNLFADFFSLELVPFIDSVYSTIQERSQRLLIGDSFGGNISALIAYRYSALFGKVGLHSAAFWPNSYEVYNYFVNDSSFYDIDFYSVWGTYESLFENMRQFRDIMTEKGYSFKWIEKPEGHSWGLWRANTDVMLEYFFPSDPVSVKIEDESQIPADLSIVAYPNPFNNSVQLKINAGSDKTNILRIFNINGELVDEIYINYEISSTYFWNAAEQPSGVYFAIINYGDQISTSKLLLLK